MSEQGKSGEATREHEGKSESVEATIMFVGMRECDGATEDR